MSAHDGDETLASAAQHADDAAPDEQFCVDVTGYEGPLHLLLDLARRQKVDLIHVSILELAEQYLAFILEAKSKRIDLAADYLLMASWLAWLKSRLLLPKAESAKEGEAVDGDVLARRLSFRLKRLEAMRDGMKQLQKGDVTGRDVFVRGEPQLATVIRKTRYNATLYDLMQAFGNIQSRRATPKRHVVQRQPVLALENARKSLKKLAPRLDDWSTIRSLGRPEGEPDETPYRSIMASYLSAALELTRDHAMEVRQDRPMSDVYLRRAQDEAPPQAAQ